MIEVLQSIEEDLTLLNRHLQSNLRTVAGNAECSSCMLPVLNSITFNINNVLTKIRSHTMSHSIYHKLKHYISELQRQYAHKEIDFDTYQHKKSCINFYLSEIDLQFRKVDEDEVPDSLCLRVLKGQRDSLTTRIEMRDSQLLRDEIEMINQFLPPQATVDQMDQAVMDYLQLNPSAKYKDIRAAVVSELFCDERELSSVIKERISGREKS